MLSRSLKWIGFVIVFSFLLVYLALSLPSQSQAAEATLQPGEVITGIESVSAAAIQIVKTVGTDPTICATTEVITVTAGTDVFYCYSVRNIGDVTLTRHTLEDDKLGIILLDFPYTLMPGASAFITQSVTITQPTVNTATWTSFNPGPTDLVNATDTATVQLITPSITLTKTVGTDPTICATTEVITVNAGTDVFYCYTVQNTGNVTLARHTLEDDKLGTILLDFPYTLVPGASAFITASATITEATVNTATWTAFNPGPTDLVNATDTATVQLAISSIAISKTVGTDPTICATTDDITVTEGTDVFYCYTVQNTGDVTLTRHTLEDDKLGNILLDFPYTLMPGASTFITQSANITQPTVNKATWTSFNPGPTDLVNATDTATVQLTTTPPPPTRLYLPLVIR